jgi:hypothetical protein
MKRLLLFVPVFLFNINVVRGCDCECEGDCSFISIAEEAELVILAKVLSYGDFLEYSVHGHDEKMPQSMTVEIIVKYAGTEERQEIKIWGDDGAQCRPYIASFESGEYYLMAPNSLNANEQLDSQGDYDLYSCYSDYLSVDMKTEIVRGRFSKKTKSLSLEKAEKMIAEKTKR